MLELRGRRPQSQALNKVIDLEVLRTEICRATHTKRCDDLLTIAEGMFPTSSETSSILISTS